MELLNGFYANLALTHGIYLQPCILVINRYKQVVYPMNIIPIFKML